MTNDDRAREAVEHLQSAAKEMIAAARAVLDVAEELIDDPTPLLAVASQMADFAARGRAAMQGDSHHEDNGESPSQAPRVQHIKVS